ncbi:hypothetical protein TNCV_2206481 [Trichonephila clavipes]|uniref:Uncharacterized protein n=1 Tax=Trichonephila clavipes TaxID=2585209 RepID=A0A8X6S9C7_TRICX|nr:hypothetical protein TNCV_2206481 [Trichonephila clavipes]
MAAHKALKSSLVLLRRKPEFRDQVPRMTGRVIPSGLSSIIIREAKRKKPSRAHLLLRRSQGQEIGDKYNINLFQEIRVKIKST